MPVAGNLRRLGFTGLPDWHPEGACADSGTLDWYGETPDEIAAVKAVCGGCSVQATCLQWALDRREAWGVWGGMDPDERAEYAKRVGAEIPTIAQHGERARYVGTKNVPGCRCALCTRAHADYEHNRRLLRAAELASGKPREITPCAHCGKARTIQRSPRHVYCSQQCGADAQRARHNRRCSECQRSLPAGKQRYCSQECVRRAGRRQDRARRAAKRQAVAA